MLDQEVYVITMLDLLQAIQKLPKALAVTPLMPKFSGQICGASTKAHNILMKIVNGDERNEGYQ